MGGSGVQRWLKMSKYLRNYNWEPIIFTVADAEMSMYDESLVHDIPKAIKTIRVPIWEPFGLYKKIVGKKKEEKIQPGFLDEGSGNKVLQNLAYWIRGNAFIPDAKRLWIKPASSELIEYLKENDVDAIVSTGPPHTTHIVALKTKLKIDIPWLADFRDPWTFVDYYDKLKLSHYAHQKHHRLEKEVIDRADRTITVTWSWAKNFNDKKTYTKKVEVITNGYDPADFKERNVELDERFTITHIGSMNSDRNPKLLWKVFKKLIEEDKDFKDQLKIKLIGPLDHSIVMSIEKYELNNYLEHIKNLPHNEVIPHLQSSQVLLLPLNNVPNIDGWVPGKLFEYLGARRPIICIGKTDGEAALIINEASAGLIVGFDEEDKLKQAVKDYFEQYTNQQLQVNSSGYRKYGRDLLAGETAEVLNQITS